PVRDSMTSSVMSVRLGQTSQECMVLMTENRLRHLPVMDGGRLIGLISIGDLVKDIIAEQKFTIEQLEHYITGEHGEEKDPALRFRRTRFIPSGFPERKEHPSWISPWNTSMCGQRL